MYDAVSCEGGVWERLAECVEAPVRQLVPLNKSWAALARDDQSALWRVLLRRLPGRRGVHAPCDGDVVRCGEARTWRDAFEGLETARYCWEARGGPARRVFRITVAVRFRPTVRDAGGDDDAAAKVTMPLHQRLAAMRAGCEGAFDRRAALRKVLCEDQNRSPASDFGAVVEKQRGAPAPKQVQLAKASSADRSAAVLRVDDAEKDLPATMTWPRTTTTSAWAGICHLDAPANLLISLRIMPGSRSWQSMNSCQDRSFTRHSSAPPSGIASTPS